MTTPTSFNREQRYIVIKMSDLAATMLSHSQLRTLGDICAGVHATRERAGKPPLDCVVVESDWPEYEPTWQAIERRVSAEHVDIPCEGGDN